MNRLANMLRLIRLGSRVGEGSGIEAGVVILGDLVMGERCYVNRQCYFDAEGGIYVGSDVHFGPRVMVLTTSHVLGGPGRRAGDVTHAPVTIGDGSWIGGNATILPGVTIGAGCVIAAGSVVTKDTDPDTIYAGVPAVAKRRCYSQGLVTPRESVGLAL